MSDTESWRGLALEHAGIGARARAVCAEAGIATLGQLADADADALAARPGFGRAAMKGAVAAIRHAMSGRPLRPTRTFADLAREAEVAEQAPAAVAQPVQAEASPVEAPSPSVAQPAPVAQPAAPEPVAPAV